MNTLLIFLSEKGSILLNASDHSSKPICRKTCRCSSAKEKAKCLPCKQIQNLPVQAYCQ